MTGPSFTDDGIPLGRYKLSKMADENPNDIWVGFHFIPEGFREHFMGPGDKHPNENLQGK